MNKTLIYIATPLVMELADEEFTVVQDHYAKLDVVAQPPKTPSISAYRQRFIDEPTAASQNDPRRCFKISRGSW